MNKSSRNNRLLFAAAIALALLALAPRAPAAATRLKAGDAFPLLAGFQLEGLPSDLKGKVVLVDFWASWCGPCKQSFPALNQLQERFGAKGFTVLAVSVDEKAPAMEAFLKKTPVLFPVVRDARQKLVAAVNVETMPSSFLIDAEGRVRFVHRGYRGDETRKQYEEQIQTLLAQKK
ncbi:MAG: TlpA family protein disulfide reductase [Verrucomicrobia bacterium]|nr:TlpA family protein disulfide reductase [Verrucomicrobiota bacterium]